MTDEGGSAKWLAAANGRSVTARAHAHDLLRIRCENCGDAFGHWVRAQFSVRCDGCAAIMGPRCIRQRIVVRNTDSEHECDIACTGATGRECTCSCQGRNHGTRAVTRLDMTIEAAR